MPPSSIPLPEIISRYQSGESLQVLAAESSVSVRTIYRWLLSELGEESYRELVTECLVNRIADADVDLMNSKDSCQIARAREMARFARMDLERRRPQLYGPKQEITGSPGLTIIVNRHGVLTRVKQIEAQPTTPSEPSESVESDSEPEETTP